MAKKVMLKTGGGFRVKTLHLFTFCVVKTFNLTSYMNLAGLSPLNYVTGPQDSICLNKLPGTMATLTMLSSFIKDMPGKRYLNSPTRNN